MNVNQTIWKLLQADIAIQKDMWRNLINTRALAKYLIDKHSLRVSLDSVISSIRRYQSQTTFEEDEKNLHNIFSEAVVSTKNNLACITASVPANTFFTRVCKLQKTPSFRIATGEHELKILVENPHAESLKQLFGKDELESVETDLSEVNVTVSEKAVHTKGVLARIASELALANINIHEIITVPPEFLIYVKQKDIVRTHESILKLSQESD